MFAQLIFFQKHQKILTYANNYGETDITLIIGEVSLAGGFPTQLH